MSCAETECIVENGHACLLSEDLRSSGTTLKLLVESISDYAIYLLDPQGQVASWNVGAERSKGYTQEEVQGRNFSMFFLPEAVAAGLPMGFDIGRDSTRGWDWPRLGS